MSTPTNILQQVQTYQKAELGWLLNEFYAIRNCNKKFKDFNTTAPSNLGDTVTFDLAPRFQSYAGLVITQQPSVQRLQSLVCSQAWNSSQGYSDQQFIFNVEDYMQRFGEAAMKELGTSVETDILKNFVSGMRINDPQNANFGQQQVSSGPFRFYGNGVMPISSYTQLAKAITNFNNLGSAKDRLQGIIPDVAYPDIVGSGLNQFAQNRNNTIAMDWEIGTFSGCEWFKSNLLPTHVSGTIGDTAAPNNVMTVVSTNDPTGANVTQITFTEPTGGTDANAIKAGDMFQFQDGVSGKPNMRFLTFIGRVPCFQPVQFVATADAATVAGTVTVSLRTINGASGAAIGLVSAANVNQNLNNAIQAGMQVVPLPSHIGGALHSGNQFYLAMPRLPDQSPFTTSNMVDPDSGASIRHYFGVQFGQNNRAYVRDLIYGATLVPENSMRLIFPL